MDENTNQKQKRKVGRPKIYIDKNELVKLCEMNCTVDECCAFFEVCEETLNNFCKDNFFSEDGTPLNFSEVFRMYKRSGNISIRRKQREVALNGNVEMLKWIGKNSLLQSDNAAELAKSAEQEDRIKAIIEAVWGVK